MTKASTQELDAAIEAHLQTLSLAQLEALREKYWHIIDKPRPNGTCTVTLIPGGLIVERE